MTILRVDTEAMSGGAAKIQYALEEIDNLLTLLNGDVNDMLASWQGDAASAHQRLHLRFQTDATAIRNSLGEMHQALLNTHSVYVQQETAQNEDHVVMSSQIQA